MERIRKGSRRSQVGVAVVLIAALLGLLVVNTDRASADRSTATTAKGEVIETGDVAGRSEPVFQSSVLPSLLRLISALAVVVVCIYIGIFLLKRLLGKRYSGNRQLNVLEVLETTYVAPKKTVTLLRVGDKSVVVGMSENQISVLTELDSKQTERILAGVVEEQQTGSFRNVLRSASSKLKEIGSGKSDEAALQAKQAGLIRSR